MLVRIRIWTRQMLHRNGLTKIPWCISCFFRIRRIRISWFRIRILPAQQIESPDRVTRSWDLGQMRMLILVPESTLFSPRQDIHAFFRLANVTCLMVFWKGNLYNPNPQVPQDRHGLKGSKRFQSESTRSGLAAAGEDASCISWIQDAYPININLVKFVCARQDTHLDPTNASP